MKIRSLMVASPVTITEQASVEEALALMKENRIRHLPVVDRKKKMVGLLTLAELKQGQLPAMLGEISLSDMVNRKPFTVSPDDDMEVAAILFYRHKISGVPVVEDGALVGVVTETDLFRAVIDRLGMLQPSTRIDVAMDASPSALKRAVAVVVDAGGDILALSHTLLPDGRRLYLFRLCQCNAEPIRQGLAADGFELHSA